MSKKKQSLGEKLGDLLTSVPASEVDFDNAAKTDPAEDFDDFNDDVAVDSRLRKQNIDLLEQVDEKYKGKKVSRKSLNGFDSDDDDYFKSKTRSTLGRDSNGSDDTDSNDDDDSVDEDSSNGENDSEDSAQINSQAKKINNIRLNKKVKSNLKKGFLEEDDSGEEAHSNDGDNNSDEEDDEELDSNDEEFDSNGKPGSNEELDSNNEGIDSNDEGLDSNDEELGSNDEGLDSDEASDSNVELDSNDEEIDSDEAMNSGDDDIQFQSKKQVDNVKKGQCVKNQIKIWENLLEMRINLQKCLVSANKIPPTEEIVEFSNSDEFSTAFTSLEKTFSDIIEKQIEFQRLLWVKYPETKNLLKRKGDGEGATPRKQRKLDRFEDDIQEMHDKYSKYRNSVITKWDEKVSVADNKARLANNSAVDKIEFILKDKARLIKQSQLKRGDVRKRKMEGKSKETDSKSDNTNKVGNNLVNKPENGNNNENNGDQYNPENYVDDEFYHQLLQQLIEVKSSDITDPVQLSKQWIALEKLRSQMKRKIDTKATKGRKIRYTVHSKLVNFMAPIDEFLMNDEAKNELFSSLFGNVR